MEHFCADFNWGKPRASLVYAHVLYLCLCGFIMSETTKKCSRCTTLQYPFFATYGKLQWEFRKRAIHTFFDLVRCSLASLDKTVLFSKVNNSLLDCLQSVLRKNPSQSNSQSEEVGKETLSVIMELERTNKWTTKNPTPVSPACSVYPPMNAKFRLAL